MTTPTPQPAGEAELSAKLSDLSGSMKHSAGTWMVPGWDGWRIAALLDEVRAALQRQAAEPVAWMGRCKVGGHKVLWISPDDMLDPLPLYTHPAPDARPAPPAADGGWMPIATAPKHEEVLAWREDAGTMLCIYTHCADSGWLTDKEQDEMDEETLWQEDWWCFGPHGVSRMEGCEVPTLWMPVPEPATPPAADAAPAASEPAGAVRESVDLVVAATVLLMRYDQFRGDRGTAPEMEALRAALAATAAATVMGVGSELPPVEGDVLPPLGTRVLAHYARKDEWRGQTVVGYYAWPAHGANGRLCRVFLRLRDDEGWLSARMLADVRPATPTPVPAAVMEDAANQKAGA